MFILWFTVNSSQRQLVDKANLTLALTLSRNFIPDINPIPP